MIKILSIFNVLLIHFIWSNYPTYLDLNILKSNYYSYLSIYPIYLYLLINNQIELSILFPILYLISDIDFKMKEIPTSASFLLILFFYKNIGFNLSNILLILFLFICSLLNFIGFGDIKLLFILSFTFSDIFIKILLLSSFICLIVNINKKEPIAFGPYICLALLILIVF